MRFAEGLDLGPRVSYRVDETEQVSKPSLFKTNVISFCPGGLVPSAARPFASLALPADQHRCCLGCTRGPAIASQPQHSIGRRGSQVNCWLCCPGWICPCCCVSSSKQPQDRSGRASGQQAQPGRASRPSNDTRVACSVCTGTTSSKQRGGFSRVPVVQAQCRLVLRPTGEGRSSSSVKTQGMVENSLVPPTSTTGLVAAAQCDPRCGVRRRPPATPMHGRSARRLPCLPHQQATATLTTLGTRCRCRQSYT